MLTLVTQDGRKLELDRKYKLMTWERVQGNKKLLVVQLEGEPSQVASTIRYMLDGEWHETPSFYWKHDVKLDEIVGEYKTTTSREKAGKALRTAWESGATTFTVPDDNFAKSASELVEDFCEEHHLTMLILGEPGYTPSEKAWAERMALTTDYWERRGCLVSDENGSYRKSLLKWFAIQDNPTPTLKAQVEAVA